MIKILDQKHLLLEFDEQNQCVIQTWRGFFNSQQFRAGCEQTLRLFEQKKPARFLVDISQCSLIKKEDTDWAANTIIPKTIQNGLKYYAFVVPTSVFTQITLENFKDEVESVIKIQPFDNFDKAKQWLISQAN